jgi:predicted MFS family arabinose efflux permease
VGTITGGVTVGFIFRGGRSELNRVAAPQNRAAVVSTFFAASYVGLGLPAVLIGLISVAIGPVDARVYISALVAVVVVLAFLVVLHDFGSDLTPEPKPPNTP